jgi:hypothetical protein
VATTTTTITVTNRQLEAVAAAATTTTTVRMTAETRGRDEDRQHVAAAETETRGAGTWGHRRRAGRSAPSPREEKVKGPRVRTGGERGGDGGARICQGVAGRRTGETPRRSVEAEIELLRAARRAGGPCPRVISELTQLSVLYNNRRFQRLVMQRPAKRPPVERDDLHLYAVSLLAAVLRLHGAGLLHCDIKSPPTSFGMRLPKLRPSWALATRRKQPARRPTRGDRVHEPGGGGATLNRTAAARTRPASGGSATGSRGWVVVVRTSSTSSASPLA